MANLLTETHQTLRPDGAALWAPGDYTTGEWLRAYDAASLAAPVVHGTPQAPRPVPEQAPTAAELAREAENVEFRRQADAERAAVREILGLDVLLPTQGDMSDAQHEVVVRDEVAATRLRIGLETGAVLLDSLLEHPADAPVVVDIGSLVIPTPAFIDVPHYAAAAA